MQDIVKTELERANKLIFVKQYDAAQSILDKLAQDPSGRDSMLVHLRRIELALKLKVTSQLKEEYAKLQSEHTDNPNYQLAVLLIEQHSESISTEEAIAQFQEVLKTYGELAIAYYGIAFSLEMQGNTDRAIYNYEQSIKLDEAWYPSYFGLSQLCYQKGDSKSGDRYFFQFEKEAPYNVYGNFDTHRRLASEFLEQGEFDKAEMAVTTLSDWWMENKGQVPAEIGIHENLAIAKIAQLRGDSLRAHSRRASVQSRIQQILSETSKQKEGELYFIARTLEEHGEFEWALDIYKVILRLDTTNPAMVQKIGSQFLSMGEYQMALDLFSDAYEVHPDNQEIRFCVLVSKLKLAEVNVEEYLIGKERLKQLVSSGNDKVEVLALLHSLQAKFQEDPEVHQQMGEIYLRMGNNERAARHFHTMYELDGKSKVSGLRFVSFLLHHDDATKAMAILDRLGADSGLSGDELTEVNWLRSFYYAKQRDFEKSQEFLAKITKADPWNVSYLVQEVINLTQLAPVEDWLKVPDTVLRSLSELDESSLSWHEYDDITDKFEELMVFDVAYARRKIRYLYTDGDAALLAALVNTACKFDAGRGTYDFLRLVNTNFDSALVYWSLGVLHKELWQLEVAEMWFEQCSLHPQVASDLKAKCYLEIADCQIWLGKNLNKAVEYAKLSLDMLKRRQADALNILTHAYLKTGQIKKAQAYLDQVDGMDSVEATYLSGLMHYRNGAQKRANEIWKPLLTTKSDSIRIHHIKQEILRYYFDGAPYLKVN